MFKYRHVSLTYRITVFARNLVNAHNVSTDVFFLTHNDVMVEVYLKTILILSFIHMDFAILISEI